MLSADLLFDLTHFSHAALFSEDKPVWSALHNLKKYMDDYIYQEDLFRSLADGVAVTEHLVVHECSLIKASDCHIEYGDTLRGGLVISHDGEVLDGASLIMSGAIFLGTRIVIGKGALVEGGATIKAPSIIGDRTEVRQGAYLRGYCLIGNRCVVGHTTEVKNSVFLDDAKAGHFAYLGDSIIGNDTNLGAGTKCANLRFIPGNVQISYEGELYSTDMRKVGAIIGDKAQTGCNSVTSPGTIIARGGFLMPNATAPSGFLSERRVG
jgi:bifunctional N-acetylglucosamine-1-phosphate-uridyltransferase/glucosamine-1-phosphate-acetyltransferase GlmU-like protein